ncbi:hypothetical protein K435DRAFT_705765 [Dendrothele bispora CBS 962.96]|uniref:SAM domain-containing protein n=1 Tax=Dendrothele bispora (strain CBS 962.96) TaxID=1314807 RepID=A0A4S8KKS6_DENBC|nr:hypothetical protein K435DRAFT_705765 [Dendrothele bispora CBS 962.96]
MPDTRNEPQTPSDGNNSSSYEVQVRLTTYTPVLKTTKKSGPTKSFRKNSKPKSKDFDYDFEETTDNYTQFLNYILQLCGFKNLKATGSRVFPMAVQVPPAAKNAATDIESSDEYIKLVSKILLKKPSKAIIVYVDEQEIKNAKLPKVYGSEGDAESGEGNSEEDDDQDDSELSQIDRQLARFRGLLEAKYGSDQDNTYAYPDPVTGNMVPLTPFMMKEWSRGMYDGIATVSEPPNTPTFDPINRLPSIRNDHRRSVSSIESAPTSDIGHLANIITALRPPATPQRATTAPPATVEPYFNSPSKLPRFLSHVEKDYGVDVTNYHQVLEKEKIGPDVLSKISDDSLLALKLPLGDIIRLKEAAAAWITSDDAQKRKEPPQANIPEPARKRVRFEKRWLDGSGAASYFGSSIEPVSPGGAAVDYEWWYLNDTFGTMLPINAGYRPVLDADFDPSVI